MYIMKRFMGDEFETFNFIIEKYNLDQNSYINLMACVSYPFQEVLDVQAMPFATVPTEGNREKRYFPNINSIEEIENYAEYLTLELFNIKSLSYKVSIQPHSGTQANQIVFNAILKDGDTILTLNPKDGGHISHSKLGCRSIKPIYFTLNDFSEIDYDLFEQQIKKVKPKLVIIGASSYVKEFDYEKIHSITSRYNIPLMADICHSVLYIIGNIHKTIFPYVDFVTFTMDKLLCGPKGGIIIYRKQYDSKINDSIYPKTQGLPNQINLFAKTMCMLKLRSIDICGYAKKVIDNTHFLLRELNLQGLTTINSSACNHIILVDLSKNKQSGKDVEDRLFKHGILVNRNLIPNDTQSALITSGIRIGTVPITNLDYEKSDIINLGKYIASVIKGDLPQQEIFSHLIKIYHANINVFN